MKRHPLHPSREVSDLDGIWNFSFPGDLDEAAVDVEKADCSELMAVPGVFDACPEWAGKRGLGLFKTSLRGRPGKRGLLKFDGLGMRALIYVDGVLLKECRLPYCPFQVEVPASTKESRSLAVLVDNRFNFSKTPLFEQFFDFYGYGGIYRSIEWQLLPDGPRFDRVQISTLDLAKGLIRAKALFAGAAPEKPPRFEIDGLEVAPETLEKRGESFEALLKVPNPLPWTPSSPNLHLLKASVDGDSIVERFGLRTVEVVDGSVRLNGAPVKLKGFCRHEAHPQFGPALPLAQLVQDLQTLKRMGCDFVRGSHYPQDRRFLELCDEMGMLVFQESLGWGQREARHAEGDFVALQEEQTRLMVRDSINHPSIIIWGFLNEGGSDLPSMSGLYKRLIAAIREEDSTRLVTYASNVPDKDLHFELCDIISMNIYPGWYTGDLETVRPLGEIAARFKELLDAFERRGLGSKPVLISEIGAAALFGWRDQCAFPWSEEYQAEYLGEACRLVLESKRIAGVSLWQYCDCRTYATNRSLGRPRAFNNKGAFDEYRRPKMAVATVSKLFKGS